MHLYELNCADKGKSGPRLLAICILLLNFFSLPVSISSHFIESRFSQRLMRKHDRDMSLAESKFLGKCDHCYSKNISRCRPFGYDHNTGHWTNTDAYSIYIPSDGEWPTRYPNPRDSEDQMCTDLFSALLAKRPFSPEHIGQKNPYSDKTIESEYDYEEYLYDLASSYARKHLDPFLY